MLENNFVSKFFSTYRVVLWIIEIPNLKEVLDAIASLELGYESELVSDH